jgi:hypothetical protein
MKRYVEYILEIVTLCCYSLYYLINYKNALDREDTKGTSGSSESESDIHEEGESR